MTNPPQLQVSQTDLDALVEKIEEAIEVHEGHCLSYVSFYPDTARRFATAITSLRNQLTASEARERELREALHEIDIEASNTIPSDGKEAAFAALLRITRLINPFRLTNTENRHDR